MPKKNYQLIFSVQRQKFSRQKLFFNIKKTMNNYSKQSSKINTEKTL